MTDPVVVAVSGDAGGAAATAPVVEALCEGKRVHVKAYAYLHARDVWKGRKFAFDVLEEGMSIATIQDYLDRSNASLLLAATSLNGRNLEKHFLAAARKQCIGSLSVLDFWSNYPERFSDDHGRLVYTPDRIAVMDDRALQEMIEEGFDPTILVVTGQPAFDALPVLGAKFTETQRVHLRVEFGIGSRALLVLFASQPVSSFYGHDSSNPLYLGYTEQSVLKELVKALDEIAEKHRRDIVLLVRPHPREQPKGFDVNLGRHVSIKVVADHDSRHLAMAADLVTGMTSTLLVEACYLRCVTVSLQPGLKRRDMLVTNSAGLSQGIYRREEIGPILETLLLDQKTRSAIRERLVQQIPDGNATKRVVSLVYRMLGLPAICSG